MQLKQMLDPESKNVCIEEETFYAVMSDWSRRVSAANNDECFRETIPRYSNSRKSRLLITLSHI